MNLCAVCKRDFASVRAFDRHRIGSYQGGRRCLSEDELRVRGFVQNAYARWTFDEDAARARRRFSAAGVHQDGQLLDEATLDDSEEGDDNPRTLRTEQLRLLAAVVLRVLEDSDHISGVDALAWSAEVGP